MTEAREKIIVWRYFDGKAGHDRQTTGLVEALSSLTRVEAHQLAIQKCRVSLLQTVLQQLPYAAALPDPDLIIGAGRRCQWPMLQARFVRGGAAIYLMKPQFPIRCFDLCLIPRHDQQAESRRVIATEGVLNDIVGADLKGDQGLILIGGPSDHFAWDTAALMRQLQVIINASPTKQWVIGDSRRTPTDTVAALQTLLCDRVSFTRHVDSGIAWLAEQLNRSDPVWISSDSVSMIYEALTAGRAVGVIDVPAERSSRITRLMQDLDTRRLVTRYARWQAGDALTNDTPLMEATRCAELILSRFDQSSRCFRSPEMS
ncbi:MAG: ELM1/GtrOC1 family putative glycosyltransferase [Proteobacteria bacterium]|nr:ELM1/GtrOC1 family putative glycosyltransferase [Pseudomonadota bacterium]